MSDLCARNCARRPFGSRMGEVSYWYGLPSWARRAIRDQVLTGDGPLPQQFTYFWIVVVQAHEFRSETSRLERSPRDRPLARKLRVSCGSRWNGHRSPFGEVGTMDGLQTRTASTCQIYGPPHFCNPDLRWRVGLLKSIRRRSGDCSPRHDEIRA